MTNQQPPQLPDPPGQQGYSPIDGPSGPAIFDGPETIQPAHLDTACLVPGSSPTAPMNSGGTPIQVDPTKCGHATIQGMASDASGGKVWVPEKALFPGHPEATGTAATEMAAELSVMHGKSKVHNNMGVGDVKKLLNQGRQVAVGIKTKVDSYHWVRIEAIENGRVYYGDPYTGRSWSVPISNFAAEMLPDCVVSVAWPDGVKVPKDFMYKTQKLQAVGNQTKMTGAHVDEAPVRPTLHSELEETLDKMGVKKKLQIVRTPEGISVKVIGPGGGVIEDIKYIPSSPSLTKQAAEKLSRATLANPADVAFVLETGGRLLFVADAVHAIREIADPETTIRILEKYADMLQAAAQAAHYHDWTLVSAEIKAWSEEMAKLSGPFGPMGGSVITMIQDYWLMTFGADAISQVPESYLLWLYKKYRTQVQEMRTALYRLNNGIVQDDGIVIEPDPVTSVPTVPAPEPEVVAGRAQPTFSGLSASDIQSAIVTETQRIADLRRQLGEVNDNEKYFEEWHKKALEELPNADATNGSSSFRSDRERVEFELRYIERNLEYDRKKKAQLEEELLRAQEKVHDLEVGLAGRVVDPEVVENGLPVSWNIRVLQEQSSLPNWLIVALKPVAAVLAGLALVGGLYLALDGGSSSATDAANSNEQPAVDNSTNTSSGAGISQPAGPGAGANPSGDLPSESESSTHSSSSAPSQSQPAQQQPSQNSSQPAQSNPPAQSQPAQQPPQNSQPAPANPPAQSNPPAPAPTTPVLSGSYNTNVGISPGGDPAGHGPLVKMPANVMLDVLVVRDTVTGEITITIKGPAPWVNLQGKAQFGPAFPATGGSFVATGTGTVAGYSNVRVDFTGQVTAGGGLIGTLTVGSNGALPQGKPITYQLAGRK